jgi:hypothetical protein
MPARASSIHFFLPILLFEPRRSHSPGPAAPYSAGARSGRQGWRVSATGRLVLDGREHAGKLGRIGAP